MKIGGQNVRCKLVWYYECVTY